MNMRTGLLGIGLALFLQGCGTLPGDRAISGAGIGAGAGAVVGAITGISVLEGAALGAAAGAITGAVTSDRQVNLGKPAWKQSGGGRAPAGIAGGEAPAGGSGRGAVADIQSGLARLGYDPGPVDGIPGTRTQQAIRAYQRDRGLLVDGRATPELAAHIRSRESI